jgi:serine protease Do
VPSNTIQQIVPQLISHGNYTHAWLGMHIFDVLPRLAENLGLKEAKRVLVVDVKPGGPADSAGIRVLKFGSSEDNNTASEEQIPSSTAGGAGQGQGQSSADVILGIDNKLVRDMSDLINYIDTKSTGDNVVLRIFRNDGVVHDVDIKLGERPVYLQN